jgi:N-acetylmuramoyl-L-alanine amidase
MRPAARAANQPLVCLDAGHGGSEPGAINGPLEEKDVNLDIAYAVRSLLLGQGYRVALARTSDQTLSSNDRYTFCNDQGATILVSIHTNSVANASVDGTLAIYFHADDQVLADVIQRSVFAALQPAAPGPDPFVDYGLKRDALGVLLKSKMPGATIESVFMSHPGEAAVLAQPIHAVDPAGVVLLSETGEPAPAGGCANGCRRLEVAQGIATGIIEYLTAPSPPPEDGGGKGGCGTPPCRKH